MLSTQTCGGTTGSGTLTSTPTSGAAVASGIMTYTAMQYSFAESIKICAVSAEITSALSDTITISSPPTPTPTPTSSETPTPTPTPSDSSTPTPTPTQSETPTPTPTPTEEPPIVETVSVGGGGNMPATIIFSGKAFPKATMGIYLIGEEYGQVLINGEFKTEDDGSFEKEIISPVAEKRFYALLIKDRDGNPAKSKFFTYDLKINTIIRQKDLIFAPTIEINKAAFTRNEILFVSGYSAPLNKVELLVDGKVFTGVQTPIDGRYQIIADTSKMVLGIHTLKTHQTDSQSGKVSDVSEAKIIRVGSFSFTNIDFNQDNQINISDWSIFLSNWSSSDKNVSIRDDLNGDGKVGISDFSVFLTSFQLSSGR